MSIENTFREITAELERLRRQLNSRAAAPQLSHSSFDSGPGHSIDEVNPETKQVVGSFGSQFDGSHGSVAFVGPIPPTPSLPGTEAAPSVLSGSWDGQFLNDAGVVDVQAVATLDWTHVEVHADQDENFTAETADTIIGTINTARGGKVTAVVTPGVWYVRLVSRSATGKRSPASAVSAPVTVPSTVDVDGIQAEIDAAELRLSQAEVAVTQAQTDATDAKAKTTISLNVPSGVGVDGAIWYRKNSSGTFIGMWEWVPGTGGLPGSWAVRKTDGGVLTNIAVTNLVAGTGTMTTGVIDKIFSDVVVAKTSVTATSFIGTNAILTGAITAPKITASEELTAKVAQFLEVNADMINTNSLWADTAWIAAARTHILTVLSNTNGQGYTSTVTGQGLKVTRTVGGNTIDVIRLGTFGEDLLAISDGNGAAVASISGVGDVGAKHLYSQGDVYANGRRVESSSDGPRGEVAFAQHTYPPGGFVTNATTGHTGAGVIDMQFTAERGRAYRLFGSMRTILRNSTLERMAISAVWKVNGVMPTITNFDGRIISPSNGYYETGDMTRTGWGQTDNFQGRFVPLPFDANGNAQEIPCRVLIFIRRLIGPVGTQLEVENIEASIVDLGVPVGSLYGQNAGAGTSTMPAVSQVDVTRAVEAVRVYRRVAGTTGNWLLDTTITDRVMVGRFNGYDYISFLNMVTLNSDAAHALTLEVQELSLTMKPNFFAGGMGQALFLVTTNYTAVGPSTMTDATMAGTLFPASEQRVGAWPINTSRTLHFPIEARDLFRSPQRMIGFGPTIPQEERGNPQYQMQIPLVDISGRFRGTRKAS